MTPVIPDLTYCFLQNKLEDNVAYLMHDEEPIYEDVHDITGFLQENDQKGKAVGVKDIWNKFIVKINCKDQND